MKALVLAAGYGERLRPLTDTTPKPLLEVGGRPLIHYPLLMLRAAGITEVAINLHHFGDRIEAALGGGRALGLAIRYAPEPVLTGTGGPLLGLRDYFGDESFVILNGDTIIDLDLAAMIGLHRERPALATLALRHGGDPDVYSRIEIDAAMRVRRMRLLRGRTPGQFDDFPLALGSTVAAGLTSLMFCGVMICAPAVLAMLPASAPFSLISAVLAPEVARGAPLNGFVHPGFFRTVDDGAGYEAVRAEFSSAPPRLAYL
jgi:NDP-sugar pyrophosphorylase family protein